MRKSPKGRFVLDLGRGPRNHLLVSTVTGRKGSSPRATSSTCSTGPAAPGNSATTTN
jgi:hypothetical protein